MSCTLDRVLRQSTTLAATVRVAVDILAEIVIERVQVALRVERRAGVIEVGDAWMTQETTKYIFDCDAKLF